MVRGFKWLLYIAMVVFVCSSAYASQTLTLSLESPGLSDTNAKKTAPAASKPQSSSAPAAKKAVQNNTIKVGLVGVVKVSSANIYQSKSSSSRKLSVVKTETPLAIVKDEGEWYGVLMTNGTTGWIASKNVKLTGYELVTTKPEATRENTVSRGGQVDRVGAFAQQLMDVASKYSGVPYVYGGTNPSKGMDCSAFVQAVFRQFGVKLPRTSREQSTVGVNVPFDQLQPGDRLYFACNHSYVDHCGIYTGNGYFVHCSKSRNGVGVDSLNSDFYWRSLVVARRS